MKRYLKNYIYDAEEKLKGKITKEDVDNHIDKIIFFAHERLVHLIVTLFYALFTIVFIFLSISYTSLLLYLVTLLMIVIEVFYIIHYFFLENSVQYLYVLYDKMLDKLK